MAEARTYSTREVAQMWNVSESTIKRWADSNNLKCYRTPGGHRKFRLEDICDFQRRRGFEATGLLKTEQWEDPELEVWLNKKEFARVSELLLYLAAQNQRDKVKQLLERLYIRGMRLEDIYDEILVPLGKSVRNGEGLGSGHSLLVTNNLEEALCCLSAQLIRRRRNGKTALCAAPGNSCRLALNGIYRILEIEGWEGLNLGEGVPYSVMAEMVESEPVNLVCVVSSKRSKKARIEEFELLSKAAQNYRIPLLLAGDGYKNSGYRDRFEHERYFRNFRSFKRYLVGLVHN